MHLFIRVFNMYTLCYLYIPSSVHSVSCAFSNIHSAMYSTGIWWIYFQPRRSLAVIKQQIWGYPFHCAKKLVTTMLTYPWKCTVLYCNHLGNTWKPLMLMTRHFDYCPSASEGDNQSVGSSAPVISRCFPGGYNVKLYISRGRLAWWLLAFLCCVYLI